MSSESIQAEWLKPAQLKSTAARRFAEFCQEYDLAKQAQLEQEEVSLYFAAAQLVINRLEKMAQGEQA